MVVKLKLEELKLASVVFHHLWTRRNGLIFQDVFQSPSTVTTMAQVDHVMYKEVLTKDSERTARRQTNEFSQSWKPPAWPFYKVNFDVAFDQASGRMGIGVVIGDSEGELMECLIAPKKHVPSVFQAESYALHRVMELCIELGLSQVCFEGDAKVVIDAVNSKEEDSSWYGQKIEDLQQIMAGYPEWKIVFVHRTANVSAHTATKLAIRVSSENVWLEDDPVEVRRSIMDDLVCNVLNQS
ncbi:uncharacterized protein LOC122304638 [Carya illinoinensis]|uniref:uncharacterized protein LOC122304638 n=1 Tax=Carya illinoinensis TaxID=32201 RepID=UPI001C7244D9|nr:uncharacterized protein LOC122304638 [Carya illinoinensis]